jgi:hypothetical protein
MARIAVDIQGATYELMYLTEVYDKEYKLRHVTMAVLNHPDRYARFTVDDEKSLVYGTIYSPGGGYRVVPTSESGKQAVYRLPDKSISSAEITRHSADAIEVNRLARRHQQVEIIGEIQPNANYPTIIDDERAFTSVDGGNLGTMRSPTAAEFTAAMKRLSAISQITGKEVFRVRNTEKFSDGKLLVKFEQLIGGLPVYADSIVFLDQKGRILSFEARVIPWNVKPVRPRFSEQEALRKAIARWEDTFREKAVNVELAEPNKLYYSLWDRTNGLTLIYDLRFRVNDGFIFMAKVNADTGEIELVNMARQRRISVIPPARMCPVPSFSQDNPHRRLPPSVAPQAPSFCTRSLPMHPHARLDVRWARRSRRA